MKAAGVVFMLLSAITFRSCGEAEGHTEVELWLDPLYAEGTLYMTPVITYEGSDEAEFEFSQTIAMITRVEDEDGIIFMKEDSDGEFLVNEVLYSGEEIEGDTLELDLLPGMYEVHIEAEYGLKSAGETSFEEYEHKMKQKIDIRY
ncbi:hypothetical protein MM300_12010 [Evansella sp. LMS18]|uniref:hypothetical protein n=1 Tax=Evansella sp. LMS18 TaxID=2924033 RepID=UPI0020D19437|nr:hypothetical protein [Evansella sp. LMS18]UTR08683.1 hypothetical protein MM300_12010 [Evansella sp. LMS18]